MSVRKLINLTEAREMIGVSKTTMARLVREGSFTIFVNPVDRREKLVDQAEVEAFLRPKPLEEGKAAA